MAGVSPYDWDAILTRARKAARKGEITPLTWIAIAEYLQMSRSSVARNFQARGVRTPSDLLTVEGPQEYCGINPQKVVRLLRNRPMSLDDLAEALDRGRSTVAQALAAMSEAGYEVVREEETVSLPPYEPAPPAPTLYDEPCKRIVFAVFCDTHFGSKFIQASALRRFIQIAVEEYGVRHFLCPGDMTAGYRVYRGQQNDLYAHGADDQVDSLCHTLPEYPGVRYYMIGGNHDYSFMRSNGVNVIRLAARWRSDFVYCGFDQAEIPLLERDGEVLVSAILWHPSGGVPYALSYRGQKFAAEVSRQELTEVVLERKPSPTVRFIFWGHLHVSDIFPHGPIWVIGPGCFEGRNGYLRAKGLQPVVQGLVIEADLTPSGLIAGVHIHPYPFLEREDDYKSAWEPQLARDRERVRVIFSWQGS